MQRHDSGPPVTEMLLAVFMPPAGFIAGLWLLARSRVGPGLAVLLLCPIGVVVWSVLLVATQ